MASSVGGDARRVNAEGAAIEVRASRASSRAASRIHGGRHRGNDPRTHAETPMRPVATFSLAALSLAVAAAAARPAFADATLDALTTRLYYHHTGTVDDREASGLQLWNTMIGEGDAKA